MQIIAVFAQYAISQRTNHNPQSTIRRVVLTMPGNRGEKNEKNKYGTDF